MVDYNNGRKFRMSNKNDLIIESFFTTIYYWRKFGSEHVIRIEDDDELDDILWSALSNLEQFIDVVKIEQYIKEKLNDKT